MGTPATLAASDFVLSLSSLSSIAFSAGQTPMASPGVNSTSQTSALSPPILGWTLYAPGPKSVSTPSANFGDSLNWLSLSESADDAADLRADGPQASRQAISVLGEKDLGLNGLPIVPAEGRREETAACDAFFMDEAGMALLAEETLAPTVGDNEESTEYPGLGLALLGTLASNFWMAPDAAKEARRRAHLPLLPR